MKCHVLLSFSGAHELWEPADRGTRACVPLVRAKRGEASATKDPQTGLHARLY
jgi:hypothetical protein